MRGPCLLSHPIASDVRRALSVDNITVLWTFDMCLDSRWSFPSGSFHRHRVPIRAALNTSRVRM